MSFQFSDAQLIRYKVEGSIMVGDINGIISILSKDFYAPTPKDEVEQEVFLSVYKIFQANTTLSARQMLNYLIFEYNIKEENSLDKIPEDEAIKKMFDSRKLNKKLKYELKQDLAPNNLSKKSKI
jgi:hypothetical protein